MTRHQTRWEYTYDDNGNRTGLVEVDAYQPQERTPPRPTENSALDNVWAWGNPLHVQGNKHKPISYADALIGSQWLVMRTVTRHEFWRTYSQWRDTLHRRNGDVELLLEVHKLDILAKRQGISNIQEFIAERIDRTQQAVSVYLHMIDMQAMENELATNYLYNAENPYVIGDGSTSNWSPSEREIQKQMASIPRPCAVGYGTCKGETRAGTFAICYSCHKKLSLESGLIPEWVVSEERRIRADHRKYAINACYEDYYGTISIDEADSYLDAA